MEESYSPIRVSTLRGDEKIPFNTYVKVAGKYILLSREGDSFEGQRLERLKGKKIARMYVPSAQRAAYDSYIRSNLDIAYDGSKGKTIEIRTQIIHGALQAAAEDLMEEPEAKDYYLVALEGARRFIKFFLHEPASFQHIIYFKNTDFSIAHHGVTVAALSLAAFDALGLYKKHAEQMEAVFVGAMIHDIEHNYNNLSRAEKSESYGRGEHAIFERHSTEGYNRIRQYPHFDPIVRDIVLDHEEKLDGTGPRKKKESEIDQLVNVVSTANVFDSYLTYDEAHPRESLKKFLIEKVGVLSLEPMRAIQTALKKREVI